MNEITFKRDTAFRKQFFVPNSFSHPAKMDAQLLIWITEKFTDVGETILDPMAGSGTTMLACGLGRNVILVELEEKFIKMQEANWEEVKMRPQLGYAMGDCQILQGDARNLTGLLADKIISSPPYGNRLSDDVVDDNDPQRMSYRQSLVDKIITSPPYAETGASGPSRSPFWERLANDPTSARYGREKHPSVGEEYSADPSNIGNLSYGSIDKVITSPPYEGSVNVPDSKQEARAERLRKAGYDPKDYQGGKGRNLQQDWNYHQVDKVITSPPYEGSIDSSNENWEGRNRYKAGESRESILVDRHQNKLGYGATVDNIGNLKGTTYLEAMYQVYAECHKVLKDGGLMILVTKNFIRNKEQIRLDLDTIKLCEQAGFKYLERWYRKLTAQSFWRIIYHQKYPDVKPIEFEDMLVFERGRR